MPSASYNTDHQPPCLSIHSLKFGHPALSLCFSPCPAITLETSASTWMTIWHSGIFSLWSPYCPWAFPWLYLPIQCHCYALGLCHHEELTICELLSSITPAHSQPPNIMAFIRSLSRIGFNSLFFRGKDCTWVHNWAHVADKEENKILHYLKSSML